MITLFRNVLFFIFLGFGLPSLANYIPETADICVLGDAADREVNVQTEQSDLSQFHKVLSHVEAVFHEEFNKQGLGFSLDRVWNQNKVGACSYIAFHDIYHRHVAIYGGLARHELMTPDALTLVVCHEIGHHLGGAPMRIPMRSNEGQSDYYATQYCAKRVFAQDDNASIASQKKIPESIVNLCKGSGSNSETPLEDELICQRILLASTQVTLFQFELELELNPLSKVARPEITKKSTKRVGEKTDHSHPSPQCRLDTYVAGALNAPRPPCWFQPNDLTEPKVDIDPDVLDELKNLFD